MIQELRASGHITDEEATTVAEFPDTKIRNVFLQLAGLRNATDVSLSIDTILEQCIIR